MSNRITTLDKLYRELKRARTNMAHAEAKYDGKPELRDCRDCELRNINAHIETLEDAIQEALKGGEQDVHN